MKVYIESIRDFTPWAGAVETYEIVERNGKLDELEEMIDEIFSEGVSMTGLNDLLWFEPETVFDWLDIDNPYEEEEEED